MQARGFDQVQRMILGAAERLADLRPATAVLALDVQALIVDSFEQQRSAANDQPWAPLRESTLKRRRKGGSASKALLDTGRLRAGAFARGVRDGLVFGDRVKYAAFQNFGRADNRFPNPHGVLAPVPGRAFLPVENAGNDQFRFATQGRAAVVRLRIVEGLRRYVTEGVVT